MKIKSLCVFLNPSSKLKYGNYGKLLCRESPLSSPQMIFKCHYSASTKTEVSNKRVMNEKTIADSNSFALNIFRGVIKHHDIFPYRNELTSDQVDTIKSMLGPLETFFQNEMSVLKNDDMEGMNQKTIDGLKDLGAFGLMTSEEYGGLQLNNTQYARLSQVLGANELGTAVFLGAHQSIGYKGIALYGNDAQKQKYLPSLVTGDKLAAYCLTEHTSGSDAGALKTHATPMDDHYLISGTKIWISNGGIADIFTVFAKSPVLNEKTGEVKDKVCAFIVERDFGGITSGAAERKMGIKSSNTTEVHFDNVKVPKENLIGKPGEGFKIAVNILNSGRFGMSSLLSGTMQKCIEVATEHAVNREQFGKKLLSFQGIHEKIARMTIAHYVCESMAFAVAGQMDRGSVDFHIEAAISKIVGSEYAWFVADEAIQILGGNGYMKDIGLEKVLRDLRIFRIFEGTNEILRLLVALTGIQYAGSNLKELQAAFKNPAANLGRLVQEGSKRVKRLVGISTTESLSQFIHPSLAGEAELLSSSVEEHGVAVERLLIKYGKNIIDQQYYLNRLANSAIEIFAMACVLSRASRSLHEATESAKHEATMATLVCSESRLKVIGYLKEIRNQSKYTKKFEQMSSVAEAVFEQGAVPYKTPLGF